MRGLWGASVVAAVALFSARGHAGIQPGTTANWSIAFPPSLDGGPGVRLRHVMVDDTTDQVILMAGGMGDGGFPFFQPIFFDDAWTTDGLTGWTQTGTLPGPVASPAATYANTTANGPGILLSTGGTWNDAGYQPASFGQAYLWTGATNAWNLEANAPTPRIGAAVAYDPTQQVAVLFGGFDPTSMTSLQDTWQWDGTTWTKLVPLDSPTPRFDAVMVYDQPSSMFLMYGGDNSVPGNPPGSQMCMDELWAWDGGDWGPIAAGTNALDKRCGASMVYDLTDGVTLLFGGLEAPELPPAGGELVAWVGTGWQAIPVLNGLIPPPRALAGFAWGGQQAAGFVYGGQWPLGPFDPMTYKLQLQPPDAGSDGGSDGGGTPDGGGGSPDGGLQTPDGGLQTPDGGLQTPDGGLQTPDGGLQTPDGGLHLPDGGSQDAGAASDAGQTSGDSGLVGDSGTAQPDGGGTDGGVFDGIAYLGCGCGQGAVNGIAWFGLLALLAGARATRQKEKR
jgi:hypothetical protein